MPDDEFDDVTDDVTDATPVNPLATLDAAESFIYGRTGIRTLRGDLRDHLRKPEVRTGAETYADSLIAALDAEEAEQKAEEERLAAERAKDHADAAKERIRAEIKAEREQAAQAERDARLRAEVERAMEFEDIVGSDSGEDPLGQEWDNLMKQLDEETNPDKQEQLRERLGEVGSKIETGDHDAPITFDVEAFDREFEGS